MKLAYDFYKSLLLLDSKLTKEIFLDKAGVKDGYSLQMFSKMYDSVFSELINVEKEYETYYITEYKSLETFLFKKYNLKQEDISLIINEKEKYPDCQLYRKDDNSYGDYGLVQFTFSEVMYDRIVNILMLKI
ncbi:hypothetical protein GCM10028808_39220 [Spirosoma migulaei]